MSILGEEGSLRRRIAKWCLILVLVVAVLLGILFVGLFHDALYNRFVRFPKEKAAWDSFRANRIPVTTLTGYNEYRGAIHNHSHISHDSEVPWELILKTMKDQGRDFIIMSDHCQENDNNLYGLQWKGMHDGVLFIQGFEMQEGFMPVGLPEGTILSCDDEAPTLAAKIEQAGGTVFIIHAEQERQWELPQISAMEIYNIHPDFMDELKGFKRQLRLATNVLLNIRAYPDLTFRLVFDGSQKVIDKWDELNITRKIGGFGGNDTHQNVGVYGIYKPDGSLLLRHAEGEDIKTYKLNFLTRGLLRAFFGPLEPNREIFRFQLDPYERMTRFTCTHVLARELTEPAILQAIMDGRAFVGFDMIADSTGFVWLAKNGNKTAVMGESMEFAPGITLIAEAPNRCRFTVRRHGVQVYQEENVGIRWQPTEPGKYRVEAELNVAGTWVPWIYANPIEITAPGVAPIPSVTLPAAAPAAPAAVPAPVAVPPAEPPTAQ